MCRKTMARRFVLCTQATAPSPHKGWPLDITEYWSLQEWEELL
jgi:hypothetical protein